MSERRTSGRLRSGAGSSRKGSAGSVAATPPRSPAMNRIPSSYLATKEADSSAPEKWVRQHEQVTFRQLSFQRDSKKVSVREARGKALALARKVPVEILAKEWMNESQATLDTRAFLVETIMPTLILGLEKLLMEADKLGLTETAEFDPNFNPINRLAQYLMRNNPRYSNFSEASPYVKSLREVSEALKAQIFQLEDNKLARIKNEAKRKREEREKAAELKKSERVRRTKSLEVQFLDWTNDKPEGRVELALIQSALKAFEDMLEYLPPELQASAAFSQALQSTDTTGQTIMLREFVDYVNAFIDDYPSDLFDKFVEHMARCAKAFHSEALSEQRKATLTNLFIICDHTGVGVLDRHRILSLFESFYDKQPDHIKQTMGIRNPRKWPVVEVDEADSDFSDDEDQTPHRNADATEETRPAAPETIIEERPEDQEGRPVSAEEKHEQEQPEKKTEDQDKTEEAPENADSKTAAADGKTAAPEGKADIPEGADGKIETKEDGGEKDSPEEDADKSAKANPPTTAGKTEAGKTSGLAPTDSTNKTDLQQPVVTDGKRQPTRGGVTFRQKTNLSLTRERTTLETRGTGSQSQMSAFDENTVNMYQFVQMTETFVGDNPALEVFQALCRYMRGGYVETEEEKLTRLTRAHKETQLVKQRNRLDQLFDKWDNEGSGYVELEEVDLIVHKYKDGLERQAINRGKARFLTKSEAVTGVSDNRVTKSEFRDLINTICEEIPGDSTFEFFVDFVETSVERTYAERIRGEARKKWLQQIVTSAETSAASLELVYRSVFQALYRDAETHGNGKVISSNIAILEKNLKAVERGDVCLRYSAATSDDCQYVLNNTLYKDMRGISFACVDTGKPLHVPRVANHGNVQFWNTDRAEDDRDGSFVVIPLKDKRKRVFGTLGVDTLRDPHSKSIFITHEIQFFQGVAKAFSIAYHNVDSKRKTLRITESAISWILRRSESVFEINVYLVEPDGKDEDYVLRRMMLGHGDKADVKMFDNPSRLERKDNLFRDYLFKCVDNSETVTADAYGQRHFAFPLRGGDGRAVAVIDISTGEMKLMPKHEKKEILRMLKLIQQAQKEISKERMEGEKTVVLEAEKENEDVRVEIMFDRLMLVDLRKNVAKLDVRAYAELKSYTVPPPVIHNILKSTLSLFYPEKAEKDAFDDWNSCKMLINSDLNSKIAAFDPTAPGAEHIPVESIASHLKDVPHGLVAKHSSIPAECLYNWIFVCLSLIQHTKRMRLSENNQDKVKPMLSTGMTPDFLAEGDEDE